MICFKTSNNNKYNMRKIIQFTKKIQNDTNIEF